MIDTSARVWRNGSGVSFCFQAEDGIRDLYATGVQTCALPICSLAGSLSDPHAPTAPIENAVSAAAIFEGDVRVTPPPPTATGGRYRLFATRDPKGRRAR